METQRKVEVNEVTVSEETVHDYLTNNPDFFEKHADLLETLKLPHSSGTAVSLVERQVSVLRQKDLKHERKLKELLDVAHANDALASKIHSLAVRLLCSPNLSTTLSNIEEVLRADFDADQSILVLFGQPSGYEEINVGRFFKATCQDSEELRPFNTFLKSGGPRCGQIRDSQRDFLFGKGTDEVGSAAMVPLGTETLIGFLAIGSADANRFHPGMSIDFLGRLGELISEALQRF
ncbi:MAG: phytochrome sensor protein [Woeseia sp.]|nr:phytochrome sensor protein [Woeseia sp.]|tara:strand:+ start:2190 stop:2894 length:705 start_codon:yes stop_codon:yes gene_type:complete